jgi:hypothetical protein
MTKFGSMLLAMVAMAMATPSAAKGGWIFLGDKTVNDSGDHDTVSLPGGKRYARIRVCVDKAPVRFYDVSVHFANGGTQDASVAALVSPGACTRAIDLKGGARDITKITFLYEAKSLGKKAAQVRVYGQ